MSVWDTIWMAGTSSISLNIHLSKYPQKRFTQFVDYIWLSQVISFLCSDSFFKKTEMNIGLKVLKKGRIDLGWFE